MNFYIDSGGTIIATDPERVYQGSAMANTIRLIAPFPLGASVTVSYILPDGTQMQPQLMTANKTLSGIQTETGVNFSVWEQNIGVRFEQVNGAAKAVPDFTVLSQVGKVGVVFNITQANATGQPIKQTTARSSFLCERGAPLEMPPEAFDDYKSLLNQILGQLSVAVQNDIYLEQAIQDVEASIEELDQKYEQSVTELEDGKVNRSGDTMQGPLTVDDLSAAGNLYTDYTAQGVEITDENRADYTAYKKNSIYREIDGGVRFEIRLPQAGGTLARESQIQDAEEWISSAIDGIREDIRNEAHFRGYVATNAEIQALKADNNDYAYSAESGTVWIYQGNAWTNSGRPVPDQSTPASNSTPLMDGTASAGTAEAYARGDHVHPTDKTLAKTIDGQILTFGDGSKNVNLRLYNTEGKLTNSVTFALPDFVTKNEVGLGGTVYFMPVSFTASLTVLSQAYWISKFNNLPRAGDVLIDGGGNVFKIDKVPEDGGNIELLFLFNYKSKGTTVTVNGVAQETWDADTKVDKTVFEKDISSIKEILDLAEITEVVETTSTYSTRVTAGGLTVIPNSKTAVKKVKGSTAVYDTDENGLNGKFANASFGGIESTNPDGTETSTLAFPKTEIPLGKTIDFESGKITDYGITIEFKGTAEDGMSYYQYGANENRRNGIRLRLAKAENFAKGVSTDGVVAESASQLGTTAQIAVGYNNSTDLLWVGFIDKIGITTAGEAPADTNAVMQQVQAYLAQRYADGNPVTIRYVSSTLQSETPFTAAQEAAGNTYTPYTGGTETQTQNENAEFGANNTVTQDYDIVNKIGG